jgi:Zn-dependent metalloprotease
VGTIHHSTCSVIPPHMQSHIAANGDDEAKASIEATRRYTSFITLGRGAALISTASKSVDPQKQRYVYDAYHGHTLPGTLVLSERQQSTKDIEAKEAFDGAGAVHDFLSKIFHRNSIDGRGMRLVATVHYGHNFNNAMWNGQQLVFGDGDGKVFNRFTKPLDVTGHEYAHGLTQFTAGLEYNGQPGALNEHISDAIGIMLKQWWLAQTVFQSDWGIGADLLTAMVNGKAIRSMKAPGTAYDDPLLGRDPQPAHMRNYVVTADDNGGVHINSGILNHGLYLAATRVGGFSWQVVGPIWFQTLTQELSPKSQFQDFADATVRVAGRLFGRGGAVETALRSAWFDVGLPVAPALANGV